MMTYMKIAIFAVAANAVMVNEAQKKDKLALAQLLATTTLYTELPGINMTHSELFPYLKAIAFDNDFEQSPALSTFTACVWAE